MKFQHTITENLVRDGKEYYLVQLKGILNAEEASQLFGETHLHEVELQIKEVQQKGFDQELEKAAEELEVPKPPPKKEVSGAKTWLS